MGRRPQSPGAIPHLRVRKRGSKSYYFYDHGGKPRLEEPLGTDYGLAIKRWAEIQREDASKPAAVITFKYVADRYRAEVIPSKAPKTQKLNTAELGMLLKFFNDPPAPLETIQPVHVAQFMRWRAKTAPVAANREKALLSHIWNWSRSEGYTDLANPCAGVKGTKETGRDVYISDDEMRAIWTAADAPTRDAIDLAYLTGQRPQDTLAMDETKLRDGSVEVTQGKTGHKLRISISADIEAVIVRIRERKRKYGIYSTRLIVDESGQPISKRSLQNRFRKAADSVGIDVQFRDLRAKAATDKADSSGDVRQAQKQLGHTSVTMTEHYIRKRRGEIVKPTR